MTQYALIFDLKRCIGCYACEVACKQEHNLPVGPRWIRVVKKGPIVVNGQLRMDFVPVTCKHCAIPPCIEACPVNAITKREDGIVTIDPKLCNGCMECIQVCPFGAPQLNPEKKVVEICTLCVERIDKGLKPACVQSCYAKAISFGDINNLSRNKLNKYIGAR